MTLQGRTLTQLRRSVGSNLRGTHGPAVRVITAAANGSTTTFLTDDLLGGADEWNGSHWHGIDTPNEEVDARVVNSAVTAFRTTLTLFPAVSSTLTADIAELWDQQYDPDDIEGFINQAIIDATSRTFNKIENLSLHGDGNQARFDVPTGISMISKVQYRESYSFKVIDSAEQVWAAGANVTASVDSQDKRQGTNSVKLVLAAGVSAGDVIASKDFSAKDLSGMTHAEFWIKSSVATVAADLKLLLDDTAAAVSPLETLDIPALVANTWTFVRVALANPKDDTAIISVGIEDDTDIGVATVWIDDVRGMREDTIIWVTLPNHLWSIDRQARDLLFTLPARQRVGTALIKLIGGDKPALLSADSDVLEINDGYVIARATELALASRSGSASTDPDAHITQSQLWKRRADAAFAALPILEDVRLV